MYIEDINVITLARVKDEVRALCLDDPERVNPMKDGGCVYVGDDERSPYCIAGQVFINLGVTHTELATQWNGPATTAARDLTHLVFEKEAAEWLRKVQRIADGTALSYTSDDIDLEPIEDDFGVIKPRPWGVVFAIATRVGYFDEGYAPVVEF